MKNKFRLHTGKIATSSQLLDARMKLAQFYESYALKIKSGEIKFASHVTDERKIEYASKNRETARLVLLGELDGEFWAWQKLNYYITGESVALLP